MCHYKINNKENTRLISESRILHLHKIMYSAQKNGKKGKKMKIKKAPIKRKKQHGIKTI